MLKRSYHSNEQDGNEQDGCIMSVEEHVKVRVKSILSTFLKNHEFHESGSSLKKSFFQVDSLSCNGQERRMTNIYQAVKTSQTPITKLVKKGIIASQI